MLFAIALFLNVSDVSAATTNKTTTLAGSSQTTTTGAPPINPKVTFTISQISAASKNVKTYIETKNQLPSSVTINNHKVTMPQFLLLMSDSMKAINSGSKAPITLKRVYYPTKPVQSVKSGNLKKAEYITLANQISAYINSNGRAPNYMNSSLGKIRYESLIYTYTKTITFYTTNKRLPNYVSVYPWGTSTSEGSPSTVAAILKTASRYGYSHLASDASGLVRYGSGDCWAMSDYLYKKFKASKIKARIVQYATAYASNHRSVQLYKSGSWVDVPYRTYGFNTMFNNTSGSRYGSVIASC